MSKTPPDDSPKQWAGRDISNSGRDTNRNTTVSVLSNNVMLFVLVGIVALGALAWALGVGIRQGQNGIEIKFQNQQQQLNPASSPKKNP